MEQNKNNYVVRNMVAHILDTLWNYLLFLKLMNQSMIDEWTEYI